MKKRYSGEQIVYALKQAALETARVFHFGYPPVMKRIQEDFRRAILAARPDAALPY